MQKNLVEANYVPNSDRLVDFILYIIFSFQIYKFSLRIV